MDIKNKNQGGDISTITTLLVLLLVVFLAGFGWYFYSYREAKKQINYLTEKMQENNQMSEEEINSLLSEVGSLIILPEDQGQPMIATIKDVDQLKAVEPFYANALNDDKLILYKDKAIIYSESRKKIVNVGPVYLDDNQQKQEAISIDIRNGSEKTGAASAKAEELGQMQEFDIADIKTANNQNYQGITIINLAGKDLANLENILGVKSTNVFPEGEATSSADVLVIVGN